MNLEPSTDLRPNPLILVSLSSLSMNYSLLAKHVCPKPRFATIAHTVLNHGSIARTILGIRQTWTSQNSWTSLQILYAYPKRTSILRFSKEVCLSGPLVLRPKPNLVILSPTKLVFVLL